MLKPVLSLSGLPCYGIDEVNNKYAKRSLPSEAEALSQAQEDEARYAYESIQFFVRFAAKPEK